MNILSVAYRSIKLCIIFILNTKFTMYFIFLLINTKCLHTLNKCVYKILNLLTFRVILNMNLKAFKKSLARSVVEIRPYHYCRYEDIIVKVEKNCYTVHTLPVAGDGLHDYCVTVIRTRTRHVCCPNNQIHLVRCRRSSLCKIRGVLRTYYWYRCSSPCKIRGPLRTTLTIPPVPRHWRRFA